MLTGVNNLPKIAAQRCPAGNRTNDRSTESSLAETLNEGRGRSADDLDDCRVSRD